MRWLALACGLFAAGVLGLYLLVAGHRADLSRMPDAAPAVSAQAVPAPQPAPAEAPADGAAEVDAAPGAVPGPDAAAGAAPADPLAATVERLRAGLPAVPSAAPPQDAPGEAVAGAAPPVADTPQDMTAAPDDPGAPGGAGQPDNPASSSADAAGPPARAEPPVGPGSHVTAQGVRWALSVAGGRPSLVIPLDDGGEAHVRVEPGFLRLDIHAMSRNVEAVRFLILHDYLGRAGDYLFTPDGRLARL
jgi:hypothetical protein